MDSMEGISLPRNPEDTMQEPFTINQKQADTLHRKWWQFKVVAAENAGETCPRCTYSAFVALFSPGFTGNGSIEGYVKYAGGGGIYLCILADGSCHS
jgi:hypothetical protein